MDTNALMMPVELDVRVFDELERLLGSVDDLDLVCPRAVRLELEGLASGGGRAAVAASVGADLADEHCRVTETEATYADDAVVELAGRECDYVVTNDIPLRDRLLERGVRVIGIRGQNKLEVTQP